MRNMSHLPTERLAALSDEPPSHEEAAHLALCEVCAGERRAYGSLRVMASSESQAFGLPLTRWDSIAAALATEARTVQAPAVAGRTPPSYRWVMQAAAALLLVAGGTAIGRASAGASVIPVSRPTSAGTASADLALFNSVAEARSAQQRSEAAYQQAAAYLARFDSTGSSESTPIAYRSRLAALDRVISTTREALRDVPHDPVINGYYLTSLGQREATLRQLNTALPASYRVNSF